MGIATINPISPTRPNDSSTGGSSGVPVINRGPTQVVGLSPLTDCLASTCRYWDADCCYKIPVFAEIQSTFPDVAPNMWDNSKNDQSSFLLSFPSYHTGSTNTSTVSFRLQKVVNGAWVIQAAFPNSTLGTYYPFYSLALYYYTGISIQWRYVLNTYGEGCYRVLVSYGVNGREGCMTSETFNLREFSCKKAHGTVRIDSRMYDGDIANIDFDGVRNSMCGIFWYDSIRFHGFFGYEESDEEKRQIELVDGKILPTRDELVQRFKLITAPLPKWFHDRMKAYGTMKAGEGDDIRVTDYNWNNSDYNINRKLIVREGGWKPEYKIGSRLHKATVEFKEGYQNVSRSGCCGAVYHGK